MRYAEKPFTVASSAMPHWYPLAQCSDGAFRTVTRSGHVRLDVLPMPPRLPLAHAKGRSRNPFCHIVPARHFIEGGSRGGKCVTSGKDSRAPAHRPPAMASPQEVHWPGSFVAASNGPTSPAGSSAATATCRVTWPARRSPAGIDVDRRSPSRSSDHER